MSDVTQAMGTRPDPANPDSTETDQTNAQTDQNDNQPQNGGGTPTLKK